MVYHYKKCLQVWPGNTLEHILRTLLLAIVAKADCCHQEEANPDGQCSCLITLCLWCDRETQLANGALACTHKRHKSVCVTAMVHVYTETA